MRSIADQDHAALEPWLFEHEDLYRPVDHLCGVSDLPPGPFNEATVSTGALLHQHVELVTGQANVRGFGADKKHVHQVVSQRDKAGAARSDEREQVVHLRQPREVIPPHTLAGKARSERAGEEERADLGVNTVRADQQVTGNAVSAGKSRGHAFRILLDGLNRTSKPYARAAADHGACQNMMQGGTGDAQIGGIIRARQPAAGKDSEPMPVGSVDPDILERKSGRQVVIDEAQLGHGADHIGLLDNAHSVDGPVRLDLDNIDLNSAVSKRHCEAQAANAAPDHKNSSHIGHTRTPYMRSAIGIQWIFAIAPIGAADSLPMNFRGLDLNLLVALDALLSERSTTRAGEKICLSQPAVSGALSRLRHFFSDELLVQVGNKMLLTPLAEELAGPVRHALLNIESVVNQDSTFNPAMSTRRFRIMLSDYAATVLMSRLLPAVQRDAPGIRIEMVSNSEYPQQAIEQGEVDLLLIPRQFSSTSLPSEELFTDHYVCIAWKGNKSFGNRLTMEEYSRFGHVVARFGRAQHVSADEQFLLQMGVARRVEVVVMSFNMIPQMVINTDRIATIHSRLAHLFAETLPLRIVEPPLNIPNLVEVMNWHKVREYDRGLSWLRKELKDAAAESEEKDRGISIAQDRHGTRKAR
jgi:LysR family transcriptional regulator, nod-box dependent transcriptional activator